MNKYRPSEPGLYLPHYFDVIHIRVAEIMAGIDVNRVQIADGFEDALYKQIERKIGRATPSFVSKAFPGKYCNTNQDFGIDIDSFSIQKVTAIHTYTEKKG